MAATKSEILIAIKRLAVENGGKPVGRNQFVRITGIKESAWRGRYWARWSDALQEAGFQPNTWQGADITDLELVRHLAELAQLLGHYPVSAERKIHRATNSAFPSANTFDTRLGSRQDQLSQLADFALENAEFADVYDIVRPLIERSTSPARAAPNQEIVGSVYLIKSGDYFKIGKSNHVGRRSYEVALQLPERVELVHEIKTDDPGGIEQYWHRRFQAKRANGEWFALDSEDVAAFRRRANFM